MHNIPIKEYSELHGSPRSNIIRQVWHKCELCQEDFLLDSDEVHKHAMGHRMTLREYNAKFIALAQRSTAIRKEREEGKDDLKAQTMLIHTDETEPQDTQLEYAEQEQDVTLQINIKEEDTVEEDKDERRRKKDE